MPNCSGDTAVVDYRVVIDTDKCPSPNRSTIRITSTAYSILTYYVFPLKCAVLSVLFPKTYNLTDINKQPINENIFSLLRSRSKTDENVITSGFECFTDLSPVEVSYYGIPSPTEKCQQYGGSCVPKGDCPTLHLYGQYRRSILTCNSATICCLPERNFYSLYGHAKTSESDVPDLSRRPRCRGGPRRLRPIRPYWSRYEYQHRWYIWW